MEYKSGILTLVYPQSQCPRSALVWPHEQTIMHFPDGVRVEIELVFDAADEPHIGPGKVIRMLRNTIRHRLAALRNTESVIRHELELFEDEYTNKQGETYATVQDDAWIQLIHSANVQRTKVSKDHTTLRQVLTIGISHHHVLTVLNILFQQHQETPFSVYVAKDKRAPVNIKPTDPKWPMGNNPVTDRDFFLKKVLPPTLGSHVLQLRSGTPTAGQTDWYVGDVLWKQGDCLLVCTPVDGFFAPHVNATPIDLPGKKRKRDPNDYYEDVMDTMDEFGNVVAAPKRRSALAPVPRLVTDQHPNKTGVMGLKYSTDAKQPPKKKQKTTDKPVTLSKGQQTLKGLWKQ